VHPEHKLTGPEEEQEEEEEEEEEEGTCDSFRSLYAVLLE